MKPETLKDKINSIIDQAEKSNQLVKKRAESVTTLKKTVKELEEKLEEIRDRHNRECYFNRECMTEIRQELKCIRSERDSYAAKFEKLENSFDDQFSYHKQQLNEHYYVLQRAFNDYVKSQTKNDRQDKLEMSNKEMLHKIDELEKKLVEMFFN